MLHDKISRSGPPDLGDPLQQEMGPNGLAAQILDALEQGVIFWSKSGTCLMHNRRIFRMLELRGTQLRVDLGLDAFFEMILERGDLLDTELTELMGLYKAGQPFTYDHTLSTGRVIAAMARPMRGGGFIVSHADVTEQRKAISALNKARAEAEEAQHKADLVLQEERARRMQAAHLAKLDEWLQSCQSLGELYRVVSTFMTLILPATSGQLFLFSPSRDVLVQACSWRAAKSQRHITPDSCWALRRGRPYIFDTDALCFPCDHVVAAFGEDVPDNFLCVPIVAHGDTVGLLHLDMDPTGENREVVDVTSFATHCGEHISMAIANVKLRDELQDQSDRDPLTGLFNRRYFLEAVRRELAQAATDQSSMALFSVDADNFKRFNDDHGHDAGDAVLEAIAQQMCALEHPGAIACRIGGEEFAVILPRADRTVAGTVAEDLRSAVEGMRIKHMGGALPTVTISIGIAIYPTHGTKPKDLLKESDIALYAAKGAGRNGWQIAEGDGMISFE